MSLNLSVGKVPFMLLYVCCCVYGRSLPVVTYAVAFFLLKPSGQESGPDGFLLLVSKQCVA